jgi:protein-S-isoprenylcysteine O-methyltransferase Ste14
MSRARRLKAAAGTAAFLVIAPGVVTGLVPWLITGWQQGDMRPAAMVVAGGILTTAGCAVLLQAFARFVLEGAGTPAPTAPTEQLVIGGLYRYVRNPMYLALQAIIIGQVLVLDRPVLLAYAAVVVAATASFAHWHEEPALARRYGAQYDAYRRAVPAWLPRPPSRRRRS